MNSFKDNWDEIKPKNYAISILYIQHLTLVLNICISQQTVSIPQSKWSYPPFKVVRQLLRETVSASHRRKADAEGTACDLSNIGLSWIMFLWGCVL